MSVPLMGPVPVLDSAARRDGLTHRSLEDFLRTALGSADSPVVPEPGEDISGGGVGDDDGESRTTSPAATAGGDCSRTPTSEGGTWLTNAAAPVEVEPVVAFAPIDPAVDLGPSR